MEKLTTIKREPHEFMTNLNYRFQKTWDIIPIAVKPTPGNAFLHYLIAFNSDIATTLQTMRGDTLLDAYKIATREKNNLIQGGKLAPSPPIPLFLDMPTHQPTMVPIPTTTASQPLVVAPSTSTSSNEIDKLEAMMQVIIQNINKIKDHNSNMDTKFHDHSSDMERRLQDHTAVVQKMNNKLVTLERQQAQGSRPFLAQLLE